MELYTLDDVKQHRTKDSLWVAHQGKVYDVTKFIDKHPGGWEVLERKGGDDVTAIMRGEPHPHSSTAYQILHNYCIGVLKHEDQNIEKETPTTITNERSRQKSEPGNLGNGDSANSNLMQNGISMLGFREDKIVDWTKPMFWQVGKLGKNYNSWVNAPLDCHIRLFYSDFVEFFSKTSWQVIPILWLPVMMAFLYCGVHNLKTNHTTGAAHSWPSAFIGDGDVLTFAVVGVFAMGVLFWTILEYSLHRWLFHLDPPVTSPFLITMHFILHGQHHKAPFDKARLVFPPVPAAGFGLSFWFIFQLIFNKPIAQIVMSGLLFGYVCYDMTHYYLHHGKPSLNYFKDLKSYHINHHFHDHKKGFGISSKLWDYPLKTLCTDMPSHNNNSQDNPHVE